MNLEDIINAAVEKRIADILLDCFGNDKFSEVHRMLEQKLRQMALDEFEKRKEEAQAGIAKAVANANFNHFKVTCYVELEKPEQ